MTEPIVSAEVLAQAEAIVRAHVVSREVAPALLHDIAYALHAEVVRAELAEMERNHAIEMRETRERQVDAMADQLKALAKTPVNAPWAECPRCRRRAPTTRTIEHDERCALSLRPPPRLSLVSPEPEDEPA